MTTQMIAWASESMWLKCGVEVRAGVDQGLRHLTGGEWWKRCPSSLIRATERAVLCLGVHQ